MKIKNIKYFLAFTALSLFSCDNYLDINEDPNNVPIENVNPRLLLPGALANSYRVQSRTMNQLGNIWMQNWGADVNNFTGANVDEYSLNISNSFYNGIWDGLYPSVSNFQRILEFDSENYDNHKAVALIMKSYYMQYIVDLYGDVPYSEAFQLNQNTTPAYDDDKEIYRDLITNINEAIELFYAADASDEDLGAADIVFEGNVSKWLKFANTLKVKILLRQSSLTDAETQTYLSTEFAAIASSGIQFLDENASINPGYSTSAAAKLNPFYSQFYNAAGTALQFYNYTRATDFVADFLNGDASNADGLIDQRRGRLYTLVSGEVSGAVQGELEGPLDLSQVGPGLTRTGTADGLIMTLSEANFILAEAYLKGYLVGDAQSQFNNGINASFALLGATGSAGYITQAAAFNGVGWTGTDEQKLEAIMTQKWIATNGFNAIESYIDYTRTGYPNIPLATIAQFPNRPKRLLYPTSELVANSANVPSLPLSQIFVEGPFWYNN